MLDVKLGETECGACYDSSGGGGDMMIVTSG